MFTSGAPEAADMLSLVLRDSQKERTYNFTNGLACFERTSAPLAPAGDRGRSNPRDDGA